MLERLANHAVMLVLAKCLRSMASIVIGVVMVRLLTKAEYGTFLQVNLLVGTLVGLTLLGIQSSLYYFVPQKEPEKRKGYILQTLALALCIGLTTATVVYVGKGSLSSLLNNPSLNEVVVFIALLIIFQTLAEPLEASFVATESTQVVSCLLMIHTAGQVILIPSVLLMGYGLEAVLICLVALICLRVLSALIYMIMTLPGRARPVLRLEELRSQLRYGLPIGLSRMAGTLNVTIDQFLISYWYPPSDFAVYARGAFNLPFVQIISQNVANVLLPRFVQLKTENKSEEILKIWHESMKKVSLITLPLFVFFLIFSKEIFIVLFTEKYVDSALIFAIYLCSIPVQMTVFGNIHQAFGSPRRLLIGSMIVFSANILVSVVLYNAIGFIGPAIATVFAKWVAVVYHLSVIRRYFSVSFWKVFPWAHEIKLLGICFGVGVVVNLIRFIAMPDLVTVVLGGVVFTSLYLLAVNSLGLLSEEDKGFIRSWLPITQITAKVS